MNEDPTKGADEMLDWLCWCFADSAERFYPPDETAEECIEELPDDKYEEGSIEEAEARGWERGEHTRAVLEADSFYRKLERCGYDPKARAEREIKRAREQGLNLPDIDWSWWDRPRENNDS